MKTCEFFIICILAGFCSWLFQYELIPSLSVDFSESGLLISQFITVGFVLLLFFIWLLVKLLFGLLD